ncbi:MAG: hypothetical protein ABL958_00800 [Bdellovibrionia bacterium]
MEPGLVNQIDLSSWDVSYVVLLILGTIVFMWVLPAAAYGLFRVLNKKGGLRDPDEYGPDAHATFQRLKRLSKRM